MKRLIFLLLFLGLPVCGYTTPSNSISVTPVAVTGAKITAADENSRNNVISSAYNAHDHTDISHTANTLNVGDGAAGNKIITANNADGSKPFIKYEDTLDSWIVSVDGTSSTMVISGTSLIFEGATADDYETTISITDPTADRTQTFQNDSGVVPLGTTGNTLKFTTTGATDVTLPTSGTLSILTLQSVYPIGSIYISTVSTNPATLFGFGTWTATGTGRVLVGKAAAGTFATAGTTGGAETKTISEANLPSHTHAAGTLATGGFTPSFSAYSGTGSGVSGVGWSNNNPTTANNVNGNAVGALSVTGSTGAIGSGTAMDVMNPWLVVFMWERTA